MSGESFSMILVIGDVSIIFEMGIHPFSFLISIFSTSENYCDLNQDLNPLQQLFVGRIQFYLAFLTIDGDAMSRVDATALNLISN